MFDGNWLYVLVVYNSGEGCVFKVICVNKKVGKFIDFWNLCLFREICVYVLKLLVLVDIFKNCDMYVYVWLEVENVVVIDIVDIGF